MYKKDTIIILGGVINMDGSLPKKSKLRVKKGFELYKSGVAKNIVLSGKRSFLSGSTPPATEAQAMKKYLVTLGVDEKDVFLEEKSTDTIGNAYFTKQILTAKEWTKVVIVTSDFHIKRTTYIFSKILGGIYEVSYEAASSNMTPKQYESKITYEKKILEFTKEWMKKIEDGKDDQIKSFIFSDHPAYTKNSTLTKQEFIDMVEGAKKLNIT